MKVWFVMAVIAVINFAAYFAGYEIPMPRGAFQPNIAMQFYAGCFWVVAAGVMFIQEKRG